MKLYYMPGACSLAAHLVANEADLGLELVRVDGKTKKTESGDDYLAVNPHGYVPALVLDDGVVLTEASVVVQYLADLKAGSGMMPAAGTQERYRVQQWLAFIATELHKAFGPFFRPNVPEETKAAGREHIARRLRAVNDALAAGPFLLGDTFTAADAYLWVVLRWLPAAGIDLADYANASRFAAAVAARPAAVRSLQEEGLA